MTTADAILPSKGWRVVFGVEIALCAVSCLVWTLAPESFLGGIFGLETDARTRLLLVMMANVVGCAWVYLYARLLFARPFPASAFRYLQEAMAIGDVVVLATSAAELAWLHPDVATWVAQVFLAALSLALRLVWLVQSARPTTVAPRGADT